MAQRRGGRDANAGAAWNRVGAVIAQAQQPGGALQLGGLAEASFGDAGPGVPELQGLGNGAEHRRDALDAHIAGRHVKGLTDVRAEQRLARVGLRGVGLAVQRRREHAGRLAGRIPRGPWRAGRPGFVRRDDAGEVKGRRQIQDVRAASHEQRVLVRSPRHEGAGELAEVAVGVELRHPFRLGRHGDRRRGFAAVGVLGAVE